MGSGKTPDAPDPMQTAAAQQSVSMGSAIANQLLGQTNQVTPNGSLTYSQTGSTQWTDPLSGKTFEIPQYTATQTLSPQMQRLANTQNRAQQNLAQVGAQQSRRIGNLLSKPMDISGAPDVGQTDFQRVGTGPDMKTVGTGPDLKARFNSGGEITKTYGTDFSEDRQRVEDALMSRLNPQLQQDQSALTAQLAAKGIKLGSAAYDRAMNNFGEQSNDARMQAILAGGQEQSRLAGLEANRAAFENSAQQQQFGQNQSQAAFLNATRQSEFDNRLAGTGFNNSAKQSEYANRLSGAGFNNQWQQQQFGNDQSARNAYLQEQYALRNQPINEIGALLGTGQVQNPNFVNTPSATMPTTDYAGIVQQGYQNQLAASQANNPWGGILGGMFGLGQAGIMASDIRLKEDVEQAGEYRGIPTYFFRYRAGGPDRMGVMAQDVAVLRPEAIVPMGDYLAVDYARL